MNSRRLLGKLAVLTATACVGGQEGFLGNAMAEETQYVLVPVGGSTGSSMPCKVMDSAAQRVVLLRNLDCLKQMNQPVVYQVVAPTCPQTGPACDEVDQKALLEALNKLADKAVSDATEKVKEAQKIAMTELKKGETVEIAAVKPDELQAVRSTVAEAGGEASSAALKVIEVLKLGDPRTQRIVAVLVADATQRDVVEAKRVFAEQLTKVSGRVSK